MAQSRTERFKFNKEEIAKFLLFMWRWAILGFLIAILSVISLIDNSHIKESNCVKEQKIEPVKKIIRTEAPFPRMKGQVSVYDDKMCINGTFKTHNTLGTGSMSPVWLKHHTLVTIKPTKSNVYIGDIITFHERNTTISHRIIDIKNDEEGRYYVTKGDNNKKKDNFKIRFENITGIAVGIIY